MWDILSFSLQVPTSPFPSISLCNISHITYTYIHTSHTYTHMHLCLYTYMRTHVHTYTYAHIYFRLYPCISELNIQAYVYKGNSVEIKRNSFQRIYSRSEGMGLHMPWLELRFCLGTSCTLSCGYWGAAELGKGTCIPLTLLLTGRLFHVCPITSFFFFKTYHVFLQIASLFISAKQ